MQWHGSISKALCQVKEVRHKRLYTVWFYFYDILGKGKVTETNLRSVHGQELGTGKGDWLMGHKGTPWGDGSVVSIAVVLTWQHRFVRNHLTALLQRECIVYKFYVTIMIFKIKNTVTHRKQQYKVSSK